MSSLYSKKIDRHRLTFSLCGSAALSSRGLCCCWAAHLDRGAYTPPPFPKSLPLWACACDAPQQHCLNKSAMSMRRCDICTHTAPLCLSIYHAMRVRAHLDIGADVVLDRLQEDGGRRDHHLGIARKLPSVVQHLDLQSSFVAMSI